MLLNSETMRRNEKVSAERMAQCEARAQRIVEALLDPVLDEADFINQLRWINPDHYQCITEERAIQKTCGYPLCEKELASIPTKKYQICSNRNKVYDLTFRKNFCSNQCYKASSFLKQQLSTSPLWVRDQEEKPKFILLEKSAELIGEEISFVIERISLSGLESIIDLKDTNESETVKIKPIKSDSYHPTADVSTNCPTINRNVEHDPRVASDHFLDENASATSQTNPTCTKIYSVDSNNSIADVRANQPTSLNSNICVENNRNKSDGNHLTCQPTSVNFMKIVSKPIFALDSTARNFTQNHLKNNLSKVCNKYSDYSKTYEPKTESRDKSTIGSTNFVLRVEKSLCEWCTVDTFAFIMGVERVKQVMLEKGRIFETKEQAESDAYLYERYAAIFKKLKILELEKEKCVNEVNYEKPTRPLPDFATLKKQTHEMEIKVRAFYRGDKKVTFDENKNENDENGTSVVLPTLHQHRKMAIRRNIILDKLNNILPDLAVMLSLRTFDLIEKIKQLALTCTFEAHNVTFKPIEWNLIGLILIKLLSLRDTDLKKNLREKENYVNAILMSYQLESNYLDLVCTWLMDLDRILKNEEERPDS